jgi:hypothetical protein
MSNHKFAIMQPHFSGYGQIIGLSQTYIETEHPHVCVELLDYRPHYRVNDVVKYEIWRDGMWREAMVDIECVKMSCVGQWSAFERKGV